MPSGRALLSILSRRYRVDKVRGPLVTLQSLFDLEPENYSYQSLVTFKQRVEYVLNGLPERQRMLSRTIDRVKDSKSGSKRRTKEYIWSGLEEVLAEVREDRNEQALRRIPSRSRKQMRRHPQQRQHPLLPPQRQVQRVTVRPKAKATTSPRRPEQGSFSSPRRESRRR